LPIANRQLPIANCGRAKRAISRNPSFNSVAGTPIARIVTTQTHSADWKVTTGYRILVTVGWGATALAAYLAAAAFILGSDRVWWVVAALAASAILVGLLLPEPVPRDMLNGHRTMVDLKGSSPR
jgi:hypothetical protein